MPRTSVWILAAGLIWYGPGRAQGQAPAPASRPPVNADEMQKARARLFQETAPELYAFQEKLRVIDENVKKIETSLAKKEIGKEEAKENMLPLVKEEQEIRNDPEYLVQQKLAQVYFSSPEYRVKLQKLMRANIGARGPGPAPAPAAPRAPARRP